MKSPPTPSQPHSLTLAQIQMAEARGTHKMLANEATCPECRGALEDGGNGHAAECRVSEEAGS